MPISDILFSSEELDKINFLMDLEDSKAWINPKSKDIAAGRDLTATFSANYSDICEGEDLDSFSLNAFNFTTFDASIGAFDESCFDNTAANFDNLTFNSSVIPCLDNLHFDAFVIPCFDDLSFNSSVVFDFDDLSFNNPIGVCLDELCSNDTVGVCLDELCSSGSISGLDNLSLNNSIAFDYPIENKLIDNVADLSNLSHEIYDFEISFKGGNYTENSISAAEFILGLSPNLDLKLANFESFKTFGFNEEFNSLASFDSFRNERFVGFLLSFESSESLEKYRNLMHVYNDESKALANQSNSMDLSFTGVYLISFIDDALSSNIVDCSVITLLAVGAGNTAKNTSGFNSNNVSFDFEESLNIEIDLHQKSTVSLDKSIIITEEVE